MLLPLPSSARFRTADPESGAIRRQHLHPDTLSRIISRAARRVAIVKPPLRRLEQRRAKYSLSPAPEEDAQHEALHQAPVGRVE